MPTSYTDFEYSIKYNIKEGGQLIVKTRNLETVAAGISLGINPDDSNYTHLHGKSVLHPFSSIEMPIITSSAISSGVSITVRYPFLYNDRITEVAGKLAGVKIDILPNIVLNLLKEYKVDLRSKTSNGVPILGGNLELNGYKYKSFKHF